MNTCTLDIGYRICFEASAMGPRLTFGKRFEAFVSDGSGIGEDVRIRVSPGSIALPPSSQCLFHAPFVEEMDGMRFERKSEFWSIWRNGEDLFIKADLPLESSERKALLKFSLNKPQWDLYIDAPDNEADPMEYPLDGLILYYLTVIKRDIMIHASGVNDKGNGYLFSGISGKGKSTMAGLWHRSGANVIHDDRLIMRRSDDGYIMYNTPVYVNDVPRHSKVDKIFIIEHGPENVITPVKGANAVTLVMANCIQNNWGHETISELLGAVSDLCEKVQVFKLSFRPDGDVTDLIRKHE